ncbi:MAG: sigma 54-interacting transcriptional regulator [Pseudomonadota bacterium]
MSHVTTDPVLRHFDSILDILPDGIFITDLIGTTLRVNRMYEQITGMKQEDIVGTNVRTLIGQGAFDKALNPEIVKSGKGCTHVQKLSNGKKLILTGLPVFDGNGDMCLVVTFVRDITMVTNLHEQMDKQRKLIEQIHGQIAAMQGSYHGDKTVFSSPEMQNVKKYLDSVSRSDATVLIMGETGVGKDVFSRYTHSVSPRNNKVFLKVDCGGISESLMESEMFGYMPGAFTGASNKGKAGYFELADGGTVFLDEIGELPLSMQTRLLRILQDREIMRVGGSQPRKVDVRIIAATNRNLEECVKEGTFRSDLYYRLNVASIRIPSLKDRPEDIKPLAENFLQQYCTKYGNSLAFMDVTMELMEHHSWPGNVRELQNLIHGLVITHAGPLIAPIDLPEAIRGQLHALPSYEDSVLAGGRPFKEIIAEMERIFLLQAIEVHGSIQKVADLFQINRSTIFRKLHQSNE